MGARRRQRATTPTPTPTRQRQSSHNAHLPRQAAEPAEPSAGESQPDDATRTAMSMDKEQLLAEIQMLQEQRNALVERMERDHLLVTRPFIEEVTPFSFLYEPHTVTALLLMLVTMCYVAFVRPPTDNLDEGVKLGLATAVGVFLVYCVVQLRDSMMLRPHPALWRFVHGCFILYLLGLVFLLCQSYDNAKAVLAFLDPGLKNNTYSRSQMLYAEDCRVLTLGHADGPVAVLKEALTSDIFMLAHFLGWVAKALIMRDWTLLWILCILWELVEYSFQHRMPNFHECWWDHWILDVLVCNFGGMAVGMAMCRHFAMKEYNWTGVRLGNTTSEKVRRALQQFSPYSWTKYTWDIFSSFRRFVSVSFYILCATIVELNAFFFMELFSLRPSHVFNNVRLVLWTFLSITSAREFFAYLTDSRLRRIGVNVWLALGIIAIETAIVVKFQDDNFLSLANWPDTVLSCWAWSLVCLLGWALLKFNVIESVWEYVAGRPLGDACWHKLGLAGHRSLLVNLLLAAVFPPMLYLIYSQDVGSGKQFLRTGASA